LISFANVRETREGYTDAVTKLAEAAGMTGMTGNKIYLPDKYDLVVNARNIADNLGNCGYTSAPTYDNLVDPAYAKILEFNDDLDRYKWDNPGTMTPSQMKDYLNQYLSTHNLASSDPIPQAVQETTGMTGTVSDLLNYLKGQLPDDSTFRDAILSSLQQNTNYDYDHTTGMNNVTVFYGENNSTANLANTDGKLSIIVYYGNGNKEVYKYSKVYDNQVLFDGVGIDLGKTAVITKTNGSMTLTVHSGDKDYTFYPNVSKSRDQLATFMNDFYYGDGKTGGKTGGADPASQPTKPTISSLFANAGANAGTGIPKSAIPIGKEDLYVLKSEIVPPVCPVCPAPIIYSGSNAAQKQYEKERPCPACERCPEPIVDCKKVIKYKRDGGGSSDNYFDYSNYIQSKVNIPVQKFNWFSAEPNLTQKGHKYSSTPPTRPEDEPMPVLNSFSSFGL
jgi:hypothetical protein